MVNLNIFQAIVAIALVFLFSALSYAEPSTVFALEAKPLELTILGDEYCEYGLSRRRPYKWCICWGKIGTRVEVLPWDCTTRGPFGLRRKRTRNSNSKLADFLSDLYSEGNSFPRKPLTSGNWGIPVPREKWDSLLEKAGTSMLKEIVESESGDSLLAEGLRQLMVPYLRSYIDPSYRNPSLVSRVRSALKFLLSELDNPANMIELEHYLSELKSEWRYLKNFIITALEELLVILKGPSDRSRKAVSEGPFWQFSENDEPAPKDGQKRENARQAGNTTVREEKVSFVSVSDDNSNLSKILGTNKALSKLVDNRLVKAILSNALATQIAQILSPAVEDNVDRLFPGSSLNSFGNNAVAAVVARILNTAADSGLGWPFSDLGASANSSEGKNNYIKTEYSNTPVRMDDKITSDQAWLDRNGLAPSKIGKILLPRRPTPGVISWDTTASTINNLHSGQVAKISILKADSSPQDLGYSSNLKRDDSVLSSTTPSKSLGAEHGNSLIVKTSESSSQTDFIKEKFGNHIHQNMLIIPERGDSSESSMFDTSLGSKLNLSSSRTGTNPEKREDQMHKRKNSSELTRPDDSTLDNSATQSEGPKLGTLSDLKQMYSNNEESEDQTETLMNSPKLTNPTDSIFIMGTSSELLKLENETSDLKFDESTPNSENVDGQTQTPITEDILL